MGFVLGSRSKQRLKGVHEDLVELVHYAITITDVDFTVIEGLRSKDRQRQLVAQGKSQTMASRHITGHAVDVAPWVNGSISWDWKYFFPIADAFIEASKATNTPLRWGGNWQVRDLRKWNQSSRALNQAYTGRFHDGPHFELPRGFGY